MSEKGADFYDRYAQAPVETHALRPVWKEICRWLTPGQPVYDLGCGSGSMAAELEAYGGFQPYIGVDFSQKSIDLARSHITRQNTTFIVADLNELPPWEGESLSGGVQFILTEVLEHLESDLDVLLTWIPPGARVFFSVPNYPSEAHVRHFKNPHDVFRRYGAVFRFEAWRLFDLSPPQGRAVHLLSAVMREDVL